MTETSPFKGKCGVCGRVWTVAYLPLPVKILAAKMTAAKCPKGCDGKVYCT